MSDITLGAWRGPEFKGEFPTLGYLVSDWMEDHLIVPDRDDKGKPFRVTDEQLNHLLWTYRLVPDAKPEMRSRAFRYYGAMLIRPQKALALDTSVATPTGWSTMGDLRVGDVVFDRAGEQTTVLAKSPIWNGPTYRVRFSDGAEIVASGDHSWVVDRRTPSSTYLEERLSTEDMLNLGLHDALGARRFRVRNALPIQTEDVDLPLAPYTLGAWLGDGTTGHSSVAGIDGEVFARIELDGFRVHPYPSGVMRNVLGLAQYLRVAGVFKDKHIPEIYLRASEKQRWALLQGLMDTDGHADGAQGKCEFVTIRPALRDGMRELLHSLGIRHTCYEGRSRLYGVDHGPKWRIFFAARSDMPVFSLARKQERLKPPDRSHSQCNHRRIVSIGRVETVLTQCITVDSPSHTFLAGREMIPTGNSGKDPLAAARVCTEALGPVVFDGWDAQGEPVGRPMATPIVQCVANSEEQVPVTFEPVYTMLTEGPLANLPGLDVGITRINLPNGGNIKAVSASAKSRIGARLTFASLTETHLFTESSGGLEVADAMKRNLAGMGGRWIECTNAWDPAERSVAQRTYEAKAPGVFLDYRPPRTRVDLHDDAALLAELLYVYGDSTIERGGWVDIERIKEEIQNPARSEGNSRRFFLNEVTVGSRDAVDMLRWAGQARKDELLDPGERITLGFHGSQTADATSLCASRLSDGRLFHLRTWQKAPGEQDWSVPRAEVHQAVADAFDAYEVEAMMCSPHGWQTEVDTWAGQYDKFGESKVLEIWLNSELRMDQLVERFSTAHRDNEITHDGSEILTLHAAGSALANGKRRSTAEERTPGAAEHYLRVVKKSYAQSISAFTAALLAYEARGWAIEHGALANDMVPSIW